MPRTLQPGERFDEHTDVSVTDLAAGARRFLLERPGRYEFRVTYQDTDADPNGTLISDTRHVDVVAPHGGEDVAFRAYSADLAYVGQFTPTTSALSLDVTHTAASFVTAFRKAATQCASGKGFCVRWLTGFVAGGQRRWKEPSTSG